MSGKLPGSRHGRTAVQGIVIWNKSCVQLFQRHVFGSPIHSRNSDKPRGRSVVPLPFSEMCCCFFLSLRRFFIDHSGKIEMLSVSKSEKKSGGCAVLFVPRAVCSIGFR